MDALSTAQARGQKTHKLKNTPLLQDNEHSAAAAYWPTA